MPTMKTVHMPMKEGKKILASQKYWVLVLL